MRDGKRQLASQVYDLSNVQVLTETLVHRVLIEELNGIILAKGVQLAKGQRIYAKEVIISVGAYRTLQVLMLSGIGSSVEFARHGIPTILDSLSVGQNFHDHLALCQWWKLGHPEASLSIGTPLWKDPAFFKGLPGDWVVFSHAPDSEIRAALTHDGVAVHEIENHHLLDPATSHTEPSSRTPTPVPATQE